MLSNLHITEVETLERQALRSRPSSSAHIGLDQKSARDHFLALADLDRRPPNTSLSLFGPEKHLPLPGVNWGPDNCGLQHLVFHKRNGNDSNQSHRDANQYYQYSDRVKRDPDSLEQEPDFHQTERSHCIFHDLMVPVPTKKSLFLSLPRCSSKVDQSGKPYPASSRSPMEHTRSHGRAHPDTCRSMDLRHIEGYSQAMTPPTPKFGWVAVPPNTLAQIPPRWGYRKHKAGTPKRPREGHEGDDDDPDDDAGRGWGSAVSDQKLEEGYGWGNKTSTVKDQVGQGSKSSSQDPLGSGGWGNKKKSSKAVTEKKSEAQKNLPTFEQFITSKHAWKYASSDSQPSQVSGSHQSSEPGNLPVTSFQDHLTSIRQGINHAPLSRPFSSALPPRFVARTVRFCTQCHVPDLEFSLAECSFGSSVAPAAWASDHDTSLSGSSDTADSMPDLVCSSWTPVTIATQGAIPFSALTEDVLLSISKFLGLQIRGCPNSWVGDSWL